MIVKFEGLFDRSGGQIFTCMEKTVSVKINSPVDVLHDCVLKSSEGLLQYVMLDETSSLLEGFVII